MHILDTAGLRDSDDTVEKIGIARARKAIDEADHVLHIIDATDPGPHSDIDRDNTTLVYNKVDLESSLDGDGLRVSALTGFGLSELRDHIKDLAGYSQDNETVFTARRRHLTALAAARDAVDRGLQQLKLYNAGELLADELLQAQTSLNEITGAFSADDLLGEIFSGFCIGK
ncbi:MAG: tRNA modification GTPase [Arenicella sp.]